jgi:hypothetical protein
MYTRRFGFQRKVRGMDQDEFTTPATGTDRPAPAGLIFPAFIRPGAIMAVVGSIAVMIIAPLYAVSYFIKENEWEAVIPWGEWLVDRAPWLWNWSDPTTVYVTYGKLHPLFAIGFLCGLLSLHAVQAGTGRLERWSFRVLFVASVLLSIGMIMAYYTPWLSQSFMFFSMPGLLLTMLGSIPYGIATLRARMVTRTGAWLLTVGAFPGLPMLVILTGQITTGLYLFLLAWLLIGLDLARRPALRSPAQSLEPTPAQAPAA